MRYTVTQFREQFNTEDACLEFVFQERYGAMEACPHCGVIEPKYYRVRGRKCYECKDCGYQLHPLANTIFHKSVTPLTLWFYVIYLFSVSKNGVSAKEIERHLGVTYKTAWRMAKQVRSMMSEEGGKLSGIIEADETYIGGKTDSKDKFNNKTAVIGIVEKKKDIGRVKAFTSPQANASNTMPFLRKNIEANSILHTDDSKIYYRAKDSFSHESVNHSQLEYVRGGVHTNTIEGFWGQMKRSIDGTYHCVSPKYLQLYVQEFVYRYNNRMVPVCLDLLVLSTKAVPTS